VNVPGVPVIAPDILTANPALGPAAVRPGAEKAVTEQFEALLLGQLLKGMRKTVPVSDEPNTAREMYQEMHDEMLATQLAKHGGIGLAAMLRAYLQRTGGTK
jgi:peptidoglycan hydrolase FlgJ